MTSNSSQEATDPTALVDEIIAELQMRFRTSVTNLKSAIAAYVHDRTLPPALLRTAARISEQLLATELIGEREWREHAARALGESRAARAAPQALVQSLATYLPVQNVLADGIMAAVLTI